MTRLGVFVGDENWSFFNEIYADLAAHYQCEIYKQKTYTTPLLYGRLNRWAIESGIRRMLKRNDVCFFEWSSEYLVRASNMQKQCAIVTRLHRFEMYEWADKVNWHNVDRVILVSQAKRDEFIARFPEHSLKTVVAAPSISLEKFTPSYKKFSGAIGTLCHLTPRKRVYELILAFHEILQVRADLHLHIAGGYKNANADYYKALRDLANNLLLEDKITFYGHVSDPQSWYKNIDIFVSNSYSEGLQVAPMEAMASGCYCLSHRWEGADELVPEASLYYTNQELQEKLLHYCDLTESAKQKVRAHMREIACERFDLEQTKAQIRKTIAEVM